MNDNKRGRRGRSCATPSGIPARYDEFRTSGSAGMHPSAASGGVGGGGLLRVITCDGGSATNQAIAGEMKMTAKNERPAMNTQTQSTYSI